MTCDGCPCPQECGTTTCLQREQHERDEAEREQAAQEAAALDAQRADRLTDLRAWASEAECVVTLNGTCGFGRPCVGVLYAGNGCYVDTPGSGYNDWPDGMDGPDERLMPPEHVAAYHKADVLTVLGHAPEALDQLLDWTDKLRAHGARIVVEDRTEVPGTDHAINWLIHGTRRAIIRFPC